MIRSDERQPNFHNRLVRDTSGRFALPPKIDPPSLRSTCINCYQIVKPHSASSSPHLLRNVSAQAVMGVITSDLVQAIVMIASRVMKGLKSDGSRALPIVLTTSFGLII